MPFLFAEINYEKQVEIVVKNPKSYEGLWGIRTEILDLFEQCEKEIHPLFNRIRDIRAFNQYKVLNAMQNNRLSDTDFTWNSGYGYNEKGRETLEKIYADVFHTEDALVRPIIVNGTHALSLCLTGILRPGDEMLSATGAPYDTVRTLIGISGDQTSSLMEIGIRYSQIDMASSGDFDYEALSKALETHPKVVYVQRSTGYDWRKALTIAEMKEFASFVKAKSPDSILMVDNCYGEFLEKEEPTDVGFDLAAGSLIKNPGGGLALTGGYIAGKADLIQLISHKMTSPGIGKECGLSFGMNRHFFQGFFMAPHVVAEALKGALLCAAIFEKLGFEVFPKLSDKRSDIIQAVRLNNREAVLRFCEAIQEASPVDAHVRPIPWDMPGYETPVIMAAGTFIQGSSIEMSADSPLVPPYIVYFQGGLTYDHARIGLMKAVSKLLENKHLSL